MQMNSFYVLNGNQLNTEINNYFHKLFTLPSYIIYIYILKNIIFRKVQEFKFMEIK